jgi:hypothetical protein
MAELIKADGTKRKVKPKNLVHFTLDELRHHVKGNIQIVETKDDRLIVLNEEGKIRQLSVNKKATRLYEYGGYDYIVGDVLIIDKNQIR